MGEDEIINEFLVESHENLDQLDRDLVVLEKDPTSSPNLASVFRTLHTLKGTAGFLGFQRLEALTHAGENLLSRLRDGRLKLSAEIITALLATVDAVRKMLSHVEKDGNDGNDDHSELMQELGRLQETKNGQRSKKVRSRRARRNKPREEYADPETPDAPAPPFLGEILVDRGEADPADIARALNRQAAGDRRRLGEILIDQGGAQPAAVLAALQEQQEKQSPSASSNNVRVDVGLLDKLMNLVGELLLARNQILQLGAAQQNEILLTACQRLGLITTNLQEGIMKTRMQPVDNIWNKFPRVVRDLALACGKKIRIEMEGKETELDKTVIEAMKDPLTHIVRNVVDHGIESPEQRIRAGKDPEGSLLLRAFHEGGQVNIEISDDGAGIDLERVKARAVEKGLLSLEQASHLNDRETMGLTFLPGLSTAEKVTNVSGRGVGMDVVKTNIEKIGGSVEVRSKLGQGTILRLKIPLTLAIIPALIVTCGDGRYAIPQTCLLELVRLEGKEAAQKIELVHGTPVYRLRGNLLPLVYLGRELREGAQTQEAEGNRANIVVLQAGDRQFGLIVDTMENAQEIVVKPLGEQIRRMGIFAGATIMSDGRVALILDVLGLAQRIKLTDAGRRQFGGDRPREPVATTEDTEKVLLIRSPDDGRLAIPLATVARLEEFPRSSLETVGGKAVVQYREDILPLVDISSVLEERRRRPRTPTTSPVSAENRTYQTVVCCYQGQRVGLVVDQILDIVETRLRLQNPAGRPGTLGSAVIQGRVTELLDLGAIVRSPRAPDVDLPPISGM